MRHQQLWRAGIGRNGILEVETRFYFQLLGLFDLSPENLNTDRYINSSCSDRELLCSTFDPYLQEKNKASGQQCHCGVTTEYCCSPLNISWTERALVHFLPAFSDCWCYYLALFSFCFYSGPFFFVIFLNIFFPSWKQLALLLWHVILECCFSIWKEAWIWKPHGCKQVLNKQNKILGLCSLAHCTKTIWERNRCVSRAQIKCRWT